MAIKVLIKRKFPRDKKREKELFRYIKDIRRLVPQQPLLHRDARIGKQARHRRAVVLPDRNVQADLLEPGAQQLVHLGDAQRHVLGQFLSHR